MNTTTLRVLTPPLEPNKDDRSICQADGMNHSRAPTVHDWERGLSKPHDGFNAFASKSQTLIVVSASYIMPLPIPVEQFVPLLSLQKQHLPSLNRRPINWNSQALLPAKTSPNIMSEQALHPMATFRGSFHGIEGPNSFVTPGTVSLYKDVSFL